MVSWPRSRARSTKRLEASLLLHVLDASDPGHLRQLEVTNAVLAEIGAGDVPHVLVLNKIDLVADEAATRQALLARWPDAHVVSAKRPEDVVALHAALVAHFADELIEEELRVAWSQQRLRGEIFASCQVLAERADDEAAYFTVRAAPDVIARLQSLLAPSSA